MVFYKYYDWKLHAAMRTVFFFSTKCSLSCQDWIFHWVPSRSQLRDLWHSEQTFVIFVVLFIASAKMVLRHRGKMALNNFLYYPCVLLMKILAMPLHIFMWAAPCGLRGCKNRPAPFPGRMSYKATKPGLVCPSYLSMLYYCIVIYYGPFHVLF